MKMNKMSQQIEGMTRILIEHNNGAIDFGFYKDGMIKVSEKWYQLSEFKGWCSIKQLKGALDHIEMIPNYNRITPETRLVVKKDVRLPYNVFKVGEHMEAIMWASKLGIKLSKLIDDFNNRDLDEWFRIKEDWE